MTNTLLDKSVRGLPHPLVYSTYSLAVCSLQFLPHTLQGQQIIRENFLQD